MELISCTLFVSPNQAEAVIMTLGALTNSIQHGKTSKRNNCLKEFSMVLHIREIYIGKESSCSSTNQITVELPRDVVVDVPWHVVINYRTHISHTQSGLHRAPSQAWRINPLQQPGTTTNPITPDNDPVQAMDISETLAISGKQPR